MLVPAAEILDDGRVVAVLQIGVQDLSVAGDAAAVQLAQHDIERHEAGILLVESAGLPGFGRDRNHSRPHIGMRYADVPGRVAALHVAGEKHAVAIDGKPPAGVADAAQHDGVLAG